MEPKECLELLEEAESNTNSSTIYVSKRHGDQYLLTGVVTVRINKAWVDCVQYRALSPVRKRSLYACSPEDFITNFESQ